MTRTKRGGFRGGRSGKRGNGSRGEDNRVSFDKVPKSNERLERYYNHILGLSEEERPEFWEALKRELPNSFRFAGSKGHALAVQKLLKEKYIPQISAISHQDGTLAKPPEPIPWYPDELAWWMTTPKSIVRRFPPFSAFQKFLVSETSVGNISRQEVVSMIPPLVMDLEPGMIVLDMCAAPGSKAAQLLEMLHAGEEVRMRNYIHQTAQNDGRQKSPDIDSNGEIDFKIDNSDFGRATGLLVANDSEYKRSHMLIHQLKRLSSPNLIVTNHDATMYPSIKLPPSAENPSTNRYLKFDRILADVPCSGDGTTRKNLNLWKDWNPGSAIGLHPTQVRILIRALQMLKVGGRVVYSTCSMNPIENEAVICSAIARSGGLSKVKLLSCDDKLPLLKRRPGLKDWSVMDKNGKIWKSFNEVNEFKNKHGNAPAAHKLIPGMFPPSAESPEAHIPFNYCMRVYAHLQDTGGFFIAVLEKQSEFKTRPEAEITTMSSLINPHTDPNDISLSSESSNPIVSSLETKCSEITALDSISNGYSVKRPIDELDSEVLDYSQEKKMKLNESSDIIILDESVKSEILFDAGHVNKNVSEFGKTQKTNSPDPNGHDVIKDPIKYDPKSNPDFKEANNFEDEKLEHNVSSDVNIMDELVKSEILPDVEHFDKIQPKLSKAHKPKNPNRNKHGVIEDPFKYISNDHPDIKSIEQFYHLSPHFPRNRFMVRNATGQPAKTIYYTSELVRDILTENEGHGIKFVHSGVKMFMKQDVEEPGVCKWRIQSEGMPIIEGYVGENRIVRLYKKETLRKLLIEMFPKVADGAWKELGEIGEKIKDIGMGCLVLRIIPGLEDSEIKERIALPLWRGAASINLMLAKEDRSAMLLRMFDDSTPLVNHSKETRETLKENTSDLDENHELENTHEISSIPNSEYIENSSHTKDSTHPIASV